MAQLAGDFNSNANYVASGLPKFSTLDEADFVMNSGNTVPISALPDLSHNNIRVEVENCVSALENIGMDVLVINTTHEKLGIPAFYTIIPGAHFRERAAGTSVAMFSAKIISENAAPRDAFETLGEMDQQIPGKYYIKFYQGLSLLSLNQPDRAFQELESALSMDPKEEDIPSIYSYMGVCLKEMERFQDAIKVLEKGANIDTERTDIHNLMGFCYFKLKEHRKAIQSFREVLRLDPGSAIDYANIASNYRDMGETEQAIAHYRLALELDPTIEFAKDNLQKLEKHSTTKNTKKEKM